MPAGDGGEVDDLAVAGCEARFARFLATWLAELVCQHVCQSRAAAQLVRQLADHLLRDGLQTEEGAALVDVDDAIPVLHGEIEHRFGLHHAGVVDQHVDPAVGCHDISDHALHRFDVGDVDNVGQRLPAGCFDFDTRCASRVGIVVGYHHRRAFARKPQRYALANSLACTGDDGDLVCKPMFHLTPPSPRTRTPPPTRTLSLIPVRVENEYEEEYEYKINPGRALPGTRRC